MYSTNSFSKWLTESMLQMEAIAQKTSAQFIFPLKLQFYHDLQDNPV